MAATPKETNKMKYTYPDEPNPLHLHYLGQYEPQGAYVQIHPDGEVEFGVNGEVGNAVPEAAFHNRIVRICGVSPYLSRKGIAQLMADIKDKLAAIHEGHSIEWNGNNKVGRLTDEAYAAREDLDYYLSQVDWEKYDLDQPQEVEA